jgi:hypothetical protein
MSNLSPSLLLTLQYHKNAPTDKTISLIILGDLKTVTCSLHSTLLQWVFRPQLANVPDKEVLLISVLFNSKMESVLKV